MNRRDVIKVLAVAPVVAMIPSSDGIKVTEYYHGETISYNWTRDIVRADWVDSRTGINWALGYDRRYTKSRDRMKTLRMAMQQCIRLKHDD